MVVLDCEAGRRMGCATLCCRLIVRLREGERDPGGHDRPLQHCVDKEPGDGLCVYLDREHWRCSVWERRPAVCREYDCNADPLLQVVLRDGFVSLTQLVNAAPCHRRVRIPYLDK